jgi:RNA polymerase sigma factor for flagellar operon FliA
MSKQPDATDNAKNVADYAPLVKRIAYHLMARLPSSVQVDDLIQAGLIGLLDALGNYDGSQGGHFESYASQRIRGAMLDELREVDWLPRNVRRNFRQIEAAISGLQQKLGHQPSEQDIADSLAIPLDQYQKMLQDARGCQLLYYEDFQEEGEDGFFDHYMVDNQTGPLDILQNERFKAVLATSIDGLPERERTVMGLYYEQELNLKEIGKILGVSESRVCQLHSQAVARLRSRLKEWTG